MLHLFEIAGAPPDPVEVLLPPPHAKSEKAIASELMSFEFREIIVFTNVEVLCGQN